YEFEQTITPFPSVTVPTIAFNEISGASDATFKIELYNYGSAPVELSTRQIINGDTSELFQLPATSLLPGEYLTFDEAALGFRPLNNARLFLRTPARMADAIKVANTP